MVSTEGPHLVDWPGRPLCAHCQHQDWFDENGAAISNLLAEKNGLHGVYVDRQADASKAAFYQSRRLKQQRLQEMRTPGWLARPRRSMETIYVVHRLASGKSPGSDAIPAAVCKHDGYRLMDHLMDRDKCPRTSIVYGTDGHLLNSRHMRAPTRLSTDTVHDLLFADDCKLKTTTEENTPRGIDLVATGCAYFRLISNTEKTVIMH
nr:unnamed protein product [Spirometra erinaceieuropaei]